jgi:hypothetical protein
MGTLFTTPGIRARSQFSSFFSSFLDQRAFGLALGPASSLHGYCHRDARDFWMVDPAVFKDTFSSLFLSPLPREGSGL